MSLQDAHDLFWAVARELRLPAGWRFKFDSAKRRFGRCDYRTRTISLSGYLVLLNSREQVEDTIRHEIAHALAGPRAKHGPQWRQMAIACGARPERCYSSDDVVAPPRPWVGTCPGCSATIQRHRRKRISCSRCDSKFNPKFLFHWSEAR